MNNFHLQRLEDETGVSGTGIVAEGVQFSSGECVLVWLTGACSIGIYDSIESVDKMHGHGGRTIIVWEKNK